MALSAPLKIAVVGGGAAGFFGAVRAAEVAKEKNVEVEVKIFESTSQFLKKVRISGGGRCNVTHHCFDVRSLVQNYPRGAKELIAPMQRFQPQDTIEWFARRGVRVIAEEDGRMFPDTHSSETIVRCFLDEAARLGVEALRSHAVQKMEARDEKIHLHLKDREAYLADRALIATGSSPAGYRFGESLGHRIADLAPSLFSFKIEDDLVRGLSGLSFPEAAVTLRTPEGKKFSQRGPLLITHWGLSGPAILKLSAWAAREMKMCDYRASLQVNWTGCEKRQVVDGEVSKLKEESPKSLVRNAAYPGLPKRFWMSLLKKLELREELRWSEVSKKQINALIENLMASQLEILGKNRFKDEFVECGGVDLKEVDFKTMQSKLHPQVYFAGEVLDVDGITGGFNFQNAWTTSWIAGEHMVMSTKRE